MEYDISSVDSIEEIKNKIITKINKLKYTFPEKQKSSSILFYIVKIVYSLLKIKYLEDDKYSDNVKSIFKSLEEQKVLTSIKRFVNENVINDLYLYTENDINITIKNEYNNKYREFLKVFVTTTFCDNQTIGEVFPELPFSSTKGIEYSLNEILKDNNGKYKKDFLKHFVGNDGIKGFDSLTISLLIKHILLKKYKLFYDKKLFKEQNYALESLNFN